MGRLKVRVHGVHHGKGAVEVDVDGTAPLGVIDLVELLGADDASAVNQDVGLRQIGENLLDGLARLGCIGDIELIELVALANSATAASPLAAFLAMSATCPPPATIPLAISRPMP